MTSRSLFYKRKPSPAAIRRKRWNGWRILGTALRRTCYTLGAIMLVWIALSVIVMLTISGGSGRATMPDEMVVVLKLDQGLAEKTGRPTLTDPFPYRQPTTHDVVSKIDTAATDPRVKGFVLSLKQGGMTLAQAQEVRAAVERFRATGKWTKFYTASFADLGSGLSLYYLATAFDEIWMQPVGMLSITGISLEMPYARGALEKIGVTPEFLQREEYKGAMENFTERAMPAPARETYNAIVDDYAEQMVNAIARDRSISRSVMKSYIDKGLLSGEDALAAKLIDRLDYGDVMIDEMEKIVTGDAQTNDNIYVTLADYHAKPLTNKGPRVAVVPVVGMIAPGTSRDASGAAADDIAAALYEAAEDDEIEAVLLRVDSPGGSPSASETIRRAVLKVQEKNKKVIVSMGSVAASGGYWVAAPADAIYALPGTLTGSIGVVMGKFSLADMWEKLGVNWQQVTYGANADLWSMNEPLDAAARARMNDLIDTTYEQFLDRVAEGRHMSREEARAVAKGRAWTGAQAKERGLVDALGGQADALDHIARELGVKDRMDLQLVVLPREKKPLEKFIEFMEQQASLGLLASTLKAQVSMLENMQGVQAVEPLGLFQ